MVPRCARDDTAGVVADDAVSVTGENFLLYRNIRYLNLRDLMVPLRGDAFKRQAKRRALTGAEGGKAEVHCFRIRTVRFQSLQGNIFTLRKLAQVIFELHFDRSITDGFVARIGDGSIHIANRCAHEIFRRAHFEIRKLEVGCIGRRPRSALRLATQKKSANQGNDDDAADGNENNAPAGIWFFGGWSWLDEAAHDSRLYYRALVAGLEERSQEQHAKQQIHATQHQVSRSQAMLEIEHHEGTASAEFFEHGRNHHGTKAAMLMENKSAMEITALVVDDEPAARRRLRSLIETDPEVRIVGECGDGIRAAEMIGQLKPNLIFLDVQIPGA